jgi:hypothetical protein
MAYSPNSTNTLGRRAVVKFFGGFAALNIAGKAAGISTSACSRGYPEPDAQLFFLWREYLNTEIQLNTAEAARDLASWNARQAYPPKPDCIECRSVELIPSEDDADLELWSATAGMNMHRQWAHEQKAEVTAWVRNCKQIDILFGLAKLETAFKTAWDEQWAAFARFVATPATTLAGLAVKTSAIFYFEDRTRRAWRGLITDPKELEPEQQILLTLRRDLLRIAGLADDFAMDYQVEEECLVAAAGGDALVLTSAMNVA